MGWTTTHKPEDMSVLEFFTEAFNYHREDGTFGEVLICEVVNKETAYIAYRSRLPNREIKIEAIVCLMDYMPADYYNFGYKDMGECCGPGESQCPKKILKLLTPTESEYAQAWRERCWENIRKTEGPILKKGLMIRFPKPLQFDNGDSIQVFEVYDARKMFFKDPMHPNNIYKLEKDLMKYAKKVTPDIPITQSVAWNEGILFA